MKFTGRFSGSFGIAVLCTLAAASLACDDSPSTLDPGGPQAEQVATLSWIIFGLGTLIFVVVTALFAIAILRANRRREDPVVSPTAGHGFILLGGIGIPAIILIGLMSLTVKTGLEIEDLDDGEPLVIEVIGWQFWWEIRYPQYDVVTANEIHVPTGRTVELRLSSVDVIHSFWAPQIAYKLDLIPGQTNTLKIQAAKPGTYRGQCAEFCGIQHAKMAFHLVAESESDFTSWLNDMRQPIGATDGALAQRGRAIFMATACSACHGIKGTEARGTAAPDLTHLMSRQYIAAGTLPNTRENLVDFITDAQGNKRGSSMPSFDELDEETLAALLAFLLSLE